MNSEPFNLFRSRVLDEIERARLACETKDIDRDVLRAQGRVAALRTALDLPAQILKEIRSKAR